MQTLPQSALIEYPSGIILALHGHDSAMVVVAESMADTFYTGRLRPAKGADVTPLTGIDPATYASWTWKYPERIFVPTLQTHLTEKVRERSRIAVARINAISKIIHGINYARITDQPFINFQQTVYIAKKDHARGFKESGYDESRITEFPFVIQHADYANIPFKQAADDILFKAKLHEEMLAQTEILRIKFFNKIKKENDPAAMTQIVSDFYNNRG